MRIRFVWVPWWFMLIYCVFYLAYNVVYWTLWLVFWAVFVPIVRTGRAAYRAIKRQCNCQNCQVRRLEGSL